MRTCSLRDVPCHRVVAAGGQLGGFGGYLELKRALLRAEGVLVSGNRIRDFKDRQLVAPKPKRRTSTPRTRPPSKS